MAAYVNFMKAFCSQCLTTKSRKTKMHLTF